MCSSQNDDTLPSQPTPRQGMLDAQLSLSGAFMGLPQPVATVTKRDGRVDAFDALKIADSIERASVESQELDRDMSCSLASAVALYIANASNAHASVDTEQVYDAVTRVLREMGYDRTARCYLRFRNVRRSVLHSVQAARSAQSIDEWDWSRTTAELVHDGGLDSEAAKTVVREAERRLRAAGFTLLTPTLVREIMTAIAHERGLEGFEHTLGHLEISQAQVARILSAPLEEAPNGSSDPEGSSRVLAARVKQAYALASVYSATVSEAHSRGDIFLHNLGAPDRLWSLRQPLERLKRWGMETALGKHTSFPAREPDTLIAHIAGQTAAMRPYFSGPVTWDALNFSFAPYVHQLSGDSLRDLAKVLLYEFAYRRLAEGAAAPAPVLSLYWDLPPHMHGVELTGPGGAYTERTCGDYLVQARDFLMAILVEYEDIARRAHPIPTPTLDVHVTPSALKTTQGLAFLKRAVAAAYGTDGISFSCDTESALLPHAADPLSAVRVVANRVTLNLPRAAYRGRDEKGLLAELDRMLELAVQAHVRKRAFVQGLIGKQSSGPLGLLDARREGRPMVDLDNVAFVVGLTGLDECLHAMTGREMNGNPEAARLAETVVRHLRERCDQCSNDYGIDLALEPSTDSAPGKHFAAADIALFKEATRQVVQRTKDGSEPAYTPGIGARQSAALSPADRIRLDSNLHPYLHENAICRLRPEAVDHDFVLAADQIEMAFLQTSCRGIDLG